MEKIRIKRFKTILKLLTTFSYFLPFTFIFISCDGLLGIQISYSKKEMARMMIASEKKSDSITIVRALSLEDSMTVPADTALAVESSPHHEKSNIPNDWIGEACSFAINPTNRSVSGFGVLIFHKDQFSWILISISILLSILVLFDELVAVIKRNRILLYAISLVSLLIFILYSLFLVEVDLEWGIGITVALTLTGLLLAIKDKRQSAPE